MHYFPVVKRGQDAAESLGQALADGNVCPACVYVVGIEDADALGIALIDGAIDGDEINAQAAMKIAFSESIGVETYDVPLPRLLQLARQRIMQIENEGTRSNIIRRLRR